MGRGLNKKGLVFIILLFCTLFISFNTQIMNVKAQEHDLVLDLSNKFELIQSSNMYGSNSSVNSIDVDLPTTEWNITKIELDFTNITFERETVVIEDTPTAYDRVYYQNVNLNNYGLATQIRLEHPETIYGVYIYGNKSLTTVQDIQVQIRGYNDTNNTPNSTIFLTQTLNISTTLSWYMQNFSTPLNLPSGNYFLVLNGTSLISANQAYRWYYNSNPSDPSLYSASTIIKTTTWDDGVDNKTFLYKIMRKSKAPLFPESINMTVNINNQNYLVLNNVSEGNGFLSQTIQNFRPESLSLSFPVNNNASKALNFNISYYLYFEEILTTLGTVSIQETQSNQWILSKTFIRYTDNYTVKFNIPHNWENIVVLRDEVDMQSEVNITENYILLPNITLIENADWEIQAESPNFSFGLNAPKTEYYLGQELGFSLVSPRPGNYTFILINAADIEEFRITKIIPPQTYEFTYELPSSSPDGTYIAYMFWNNGTDAAVQVQEFIIKLTITPEFDPTLLIIIGVVVGIIAALSIISYIGLRKILNKRQYQIGRVLEKCIDILNLNYLIVTDRRSGVDIYSQSFGEQKLDPSLISGFLQAIREFGTEARVDKGSRTVNIDYKDTVILMTEFVNIRLILNMKEHPSQNFHYDIESLAYDIYKTYGKDIEDFRGNVKKFSGIKELVEKNLNTSFIYPLEVIPNEKIKLSQSEREMVNKALHFMKEHNFDYVYSIYLLPENECSPKDAQAVLNLISKGVFKPKTLINDKD
jgi:hypothetical protein